MTTRLILLIFSVTLAAGTTQFAATAGLLRLPRSLLGRSLAVILIAYIALLWYRPASLAISNISLLTTAAIVATAIGVRFKAVQPIIVFSVAASIADILSFTIGPTRSVLEGSDRAAGSLISYLALSIPAPDTIVPVVGIGDLMVLGIYFVALKQIRVPPFARLALPLAGLLAALGAGLAMGGAFGIPFMAAAVVVYLQLAGPDRFRRESAGRR